MSGSKSSIFKHTLYALSAQVLNLLVSVCLSLILPRFIPVADYGYWQLFVLYSSYIGILHLGYCDGIYLKYGGSRFEDLNKEELAPQFRTYILIQFLFSILIIIGGLIFSVGVEKRLIYLLLGIYSFVVNIYTLESYLLLATNNIIKYSLSVIYSKLVLLVLILVIIFSPLQFNYWKIVVAYIFTFGIGMLYLYPKYKFFFNIKNKMRTNDYKSQWRIVLIGFVLMFSNVVGNLILGSGRMIVGYFWNIQVFAKLSFSIAISMFLLAFFSQIGTVLFPILRNMDDRSAIFVLKDGSFIIGYGVMLCFIFIIPLHFFVHYWLPDYEDSLIYVVYLLPMSLYLIKTQIIYITFFKSLNKQKILMLINLFSLLLALVMYMISALYHSLEALVISMLITCLCRSWIMLIYLNNHYKTPFESINWAEILFTGMFVWCYKYLGLKETCIFYILSFVIITLCYRKYIHTILKYFIKIKGVNIR